MSILAWSITEYNHCKFRARTAFLNTFSTKALELAREEAVKFILLKSGSEGSGAFTTDPATTPRNSD
jgi:uncharacterized protein YbbK (DUF523 family)